MWLTTCDDRKTRLTQAGIAALFALLLATIPVAVYSVTSAWFVIGPIIGVFAVMSIGLAALNLAYAIAALIIPVPALRILLAFALWPVIYVGDRIPYILEDREVHVAPPVTTGAPVSLTPGGRLAVISNVVEIHSLQHPYTSVVGNCANDWCWGTRSVSAPTQTNEIAVWQEKISDVITDLDLLPSPPEAGLPLLRVTVVRQGLAWRLQLELKDASGKPVASAEHYYRDGFPGETQIDDNLQGSRSVFAYFELLRRSRALVTFLPRNISTNREPVRSFLTQHVRVVLPRFNNNPAVAKAQYGSLGIEHAIDATHVMSVERHALPDEPWNTERWACGSLVKPVPSRASQSSWHTIGFRGDTSGQRRLSFANSALFCSDTKIWLIGLDDQGYAIFSRIADDGNFEESILLDVRELPRGAQYHISHAWECSGTCRMNVSRDGNDTVMTFLTYHDKGRGVFELQPIARELRFSGVRLQP